MPEHGDGLLGGDAKHFLEGQAEVRDIPESQAKGYFFDRQITVGHTFHCFPHSMTHPVSCRGQAVLLLKQCPKMLGRVTGLPTE